MFLKICKTILEKDIIISSLKVALVVGVILNLINQGIFYIPCSLKK